MRGDLYVREENEFNEKFRDIFEKETIWIKQSISKQKKN
jgi:hypothetical protein